MIKNKSFVILYIIIAFVILFFLFLFIIFSLNIKFPFFNSVFSEKYLEVISKITYLEGNEIFYTIKGKKKNPVDNNTKIQRDMIIETGKNSFIGFYIKDQGFYYLYPDSSLYISKIENYNTEKATKESLFTLEKGLLYLNINFFSKNSNLILETQDIFTLMNKSQIIVDKTNDFFTKVFCIDGDIFYRSFSEKFSFFEQKKNFVITSSIERLINSSNNLKINQWTQLDGSYQNRLDNLLNKIYESQNTKLINKNYITEYLKIPAFQIKEQVSKDFNLPNLELSKFNLSNKAHLELLTPPDNSLAKFENKYLKNNTRYLFLLDIGKYQLTQIFNFTTVINNIQIKENEYKKIILKNYNGITDVFLNGIKSIFEVNNFFTQIGNTKITGNLLLVNIKNNVNNLKSISLNSDIEIKNLFLLSDKSIKSDILNDMKTNIFIKNKSYKIYRLKFNNKKNIQFQLEKVINEHNIFLIVEYEKNYINEF